MSSARNKDVANLDSGIMRSLDRARLAPGNLAAMSETSSATYELDPGAPSEVSW